MSNKEENYLKFWHVQETETWPLLFRAYRRRGTARSLKRWEVIRSYQTLYFIEFGFCSTVFEIEKPLTLHSVKSILIEPPCCSGST